MKSFVILWVAGLIACDKLDRTYLPPPGSNTAGGRPGDLNLPFEYPKENYPSTLAPAAESYSPRSGDTTKLVFNIPNSTPSNIFSPKSTLPNIERYGTTVGSVSPQRYPSTISVIEPTVNYQSFTNQQIVPSGSSQKFIPAQNNNVVQAFVAYPNGTLQKNIGNRLVNEPGTFRTKSPSIIQSTPAVIEPSHYNRDDLDSVSGVTSSTATTVYPDDYDEQGSVTYKPYGNSIPRTSSSFGSGNENNKDISATLSTLAPQSYPSPTTGTDELSSDNSADSRYFLKNNVGNNRPERIQAEADRNAVIINYENLLTPEGFAYSYDTSNGIHADESGTTTNGVKAQGSYSYIGDDGEIYRISYTADERGFIPRGDHLPTSPPIPKAILKVIEEAESNRQLGIIDDGSYDDSKYGHGKYQGLIDRIPQQQYDNLIRKQQGINDGLIQSKTISHERQRLPGEVNVSSRIPYNDNRNNSYSTVENYQFLPSAYQYNNDNLRNSQDAPGISNQLIDEPQGKLTGTSSSIPFKNSDKTPNFPSKIDGTEENLNLPSHQGYNYNRPQIGFNQNRIQPSPVNNEKGIEILPGNIYKGDVLLPSTKSATASPNFNTERNQYSYSSMRPLNYDYKRPVTVTDKPSNAYSDINNNRIFSTRKPILGSITSDPYNFASSSTPAPGTINQEYYSSTSSPQYSSTTPIPSRYSASTVNGVRFSPTSPSTFASSTLRPISSTTLLSTSRRPSYSVSISEPYPEFGSTTIRPVSSVSRINERPRYRGSTNSPGSTDSDKDFVRQDPSNYFQKQEKTRYGIADSENTPVPGFGVQSSTERVVAEDFSGPKQAQRYDPQHGYYY